MGSNGGGKHGEANISQTSSCENGFETVIQHVASCAEEDVEIEQKRRRGSGQ